MSTTETTNTTRPAAYVMVLAIFAMGASTAVDITKTVLATEFDLVRLDLGIAFTFEGDKVVLSGTFHDVVMAAAALDAAGVLDTPAGRKIKAIKAKHAAAA